MSDVVMFIKGFVFHVLVNKRFTPLSVEPIKEELNNETNGGFAMALCWFLVLVTHFFILLLMAQLADAGAVVSHGVHQAIGKLS